VAKDEGLVRGIGLPGAISLNMINMIGVGPFVTLPLIVMAMHGPQAILGWILGAVLAACDGLVWAELGAAMSICALSMGRDAGEDFSRFCISGS
jgi:amino acid transporter